MFTQFKAWLHATTFYQIYFVRAKKKPTTKLWYMFSCIFLMVSLSFLMDLFNPVYRLEQMQRIEGTIQEFHERGRSSCGDRVYLKIPDGNIEKYRASVDQAQFDFFQNSKNKLIAIWAHNELTLCGTVRRIEQIQYKDHLIGTPYSEIEPRARSLHQASPKWFSILFSLGLFPLLYIGWRYRKTDIV